VTFENNGTSIGTGTLLPQQRCRLAPIPSRRSTGGIRTSTVRLRRPFRRK
jgi:hypothetical protein